MWMCWTLFDDDPIWLIALLFLTMSKRRRNWLIIELFQEFMPSSKRSIIDRFLRLLNIVKRSNAIGRLFWINKTEKGPNRCTKIVYQNLLYVTMLLSNLRSDLLGSQNWSFSILFLAWSIDYSASVVEPWQFSWSQLKLVQTTTRTRRAVKGAGQSSFPRH